MRRVKSKVTVVVMEVSRDSESCHTRQFFISGAMEGYMREDPVERVRIDNAAQRFAKSASRALAEALAEGGVMTTRVEAATDMASAPTSSSLRRRVLAAANVVRGKGRLTRHTTLCTSL